MVGLFQKIDSCKGVFLQRTKGVEKSLHNVKRALPNVERDLPNVKRALPIVKSARRRLLQRVSSVSRAFVIENGFEKSP